MNGRTHILNDRPRRKKNEKFCFIRLKEVASELVK